MKTARREKGARLEDVAARKASFACEKKERRMLLQKLGKNL